MTDSPYDPKCVFCPKNDKLDIIRTSPSGNTNFVQVVKFVDGMPSPVTGAYFVIPAGHYLPCDDLPFDFWAERVWHIRESGLVFDNGGENLTIEGGRLQKHLHYWLMQALPSDPPLGLHTLREKFRELVLEQAHNRNDRSHGRGKW